MSLNNPGYVKDQYCDSSNLEARIALHARFGTSRCNFHRWVFDHFDLRQHARVLELGCGRGSLWEANGERIPADWRLTLSDLSLGMLRATRAAGVPARLLQLDAQVIPFGEQSFDAVVANHMLYHIPDLPRALGEIRRILSHGGKLYAATNGVEHMHELHELVNSVGNDTSPILRNQFTLEKGAEQLDRYFVGAERFDFDDALVVTEVKPLMAYIKSGFNGQRLVAIGRENDLRYLVEERIARDGAFQITKSQGMFVASKE